jgi:hypothetical protein
MSTSRTTGAFVGTDESTLQSIGNGATHSGSEVDVLGDNASFGEAWAYVVITGSAVSTIELWINQRRVTGQAYTKTQSDLTLPTTNGTQKIPIGSMKVSRYMQVDVKNNNGSASVSVAVLYELEKFTGA